MWNDKLLLLIYALSYLILIFSWRIYIIWRKTGSNPVMYKFKDSAHDYVGKVLTLALLCSLLIVIIYIFFERFYIFSIPIRILESSSLKSIGFIIGWLSLFWVFMAQSQMKNDWRIGIDLNKQVRIFKKGLFGLSRHPIYLGVITLLMLNIQARLEEEYLLRKKKEE